MFTQYKFDVENNDEYGFLGLKARFLKNAEPMLALTCTHDILEHSRGEYIDINTEIMALGSLVYVRNYHIRNSMFSIEFHIASDLLNMLATEQWGTLTNPGRTAMVNDSYFESIVDNTLEVLKESMPKEFPSYVFDENCDKYIRGWMRKGFRRARKRWGNHSTFEMSNLFDDISNEISKLEKRMDHGMVLTVGLDHKTLRTYFNLDYEYEDEH